MFKYGPFDQKDIEHLRNMLYNLDMDKLGARDTMHQFNNIVMSMTLTAKRDGNNNIMRAAIEPALPAPLPINATPDQIIDHWQQTQNAINDVAGLEGPALNHRPTEEDLKTHIKKILSKTTIKDFHNIYVESIKPQNATWTFQDIVDQIERLIDHESDGIQLYADERRAFSQLSINDNNNRMAKQQVLRNLPDRNYYSGDESYTRSYSPGTYTNSSNRDQGRSTNPGSPGGPGGRDACLNCGQRGHRSFTCPSRICGQCKGSFESYPRRSERETRDRSRSRSRERISFGTRERSRSRSRSPTEKNWKKKHKWRKRQPN
mmetsp:Transcript_14206/g.21141  ORF Transcript_14206/g.21141 Transcript_14206/m.21141 type:complete len:318 (+) Transcript_14206:612-1565(+)